MAVPPPPRGRIPIFDQFRRILLRLHLLRRLSHLLNTALHGTKIYIWPALQWHSNVDAVLHSILSCAFLRVRSGGVETTYNTPRNPLYTTKEFFFKAYLSPNTTQLHDGVTLPLRPESFSYFPFMFLFLNLVIPARWKALIWTRKRNPEDSGRSSKIASSCQWPFSSFLLASSLMLNSSFYFN